MAEFGRRLRLDRAIDAEVEEILSTYQLLFTEIVPIDTVVAKTVFVIGCRTARRLPLIDAFIAAVAQVKVAILVHRDEHMRSIPSELVRQQELANEVTQ